MACTHKQFKCTDNVFYCCLCGVVIDNPYKGDKSTGQEEKPAQTAKKAVKRKTKAEA